MAGGKGENAVNSGEVLGESSSLSVFCHCLSFALKSKGERRQGACALRHRKRSICQDGGASFPLPERRLGVRKCFEAQITFRAFRDRVPARTGGNNRHLKLLSFALWMIPSPSLPSEHLPHNIVRKEKKKCIMAARNSHARQKYSDHT